MTSVIMSPPQIYEVKNAICKVKSVGIALAVGNNRQVIAGATGVIIRVMGWFVQSITAVGQCQFIDGSGGAALTDDHYTPLDTSGNFWTAPLQHSGYFETTSGTGLFADISDTCRSAALAKPLASSITWFIKAINTWLGS